MTLSTNCNTRAYDSYFELLNNDPSRPSDGERATVGVTETEADVRLGKALERFFFVTQIIAERCPGFWMKRSGPLARIQSTSIADVELLASFKSTGRVRKPFCSETLFKLVCVN